MITMHLFKSSAPKSILLGVATRRKVPIFGPLRHKPAVLAWPWKLVIFITKGTEIEATWVFSKIYFCLYFAQIPYSLKVCRLNCIGYTLHYNILNPWNSFSYLFIKHKLSVHLFFQKLKFVSKLNHEKLINDVTMCNGMTFWLQMKNIWLFIACSIMRVLKFYNFYDLMIYIQSNCTRTVLKVRFSPRKCSILNEMNLNALVPYYWFYSVNYQ